MQKQQWMANVDHITTKNAMCCNQVTITVVTKQTF